MLKFVDVNCHHFALNDVRALYSSAFPKKEQTPFFFLKNRSRNGRTRFWGIYENGEFIGLTYLIFYCDIVYVYYFAVAENMRGKGYGSRILKAVCRRYEGMRIILCIEPVDECTDNYSQRAARLRFYEKNGFSLSGILVRERGVDYDALCYGGNVEAEELEELMLSYVGDFLACFVELEVY